MAVMNFAAHTLSYKEVEPGHEDKNGDWVQGSERWVEDYCKCDIVPAGKANVITLPDGSVQSYTYSIYNLPKTCKNFEYGDTIKLSFYGRDEKVFKVLGFHRYQLQCKMWV